MAGRPRGAHARDDMIRVRMTSTGKDRARQAAGGLSLSDYVRQLIEADVRKKGL
jgi:hypothetical protein